MKMSFMSYLFIAMTGAFMSWNSQTEKVLLRKLGAVHLWRGKSYRVSTLHETLRDAVWSPLVGDALNIHYLSKGHFCHHI